ncbi:MAG: lysophospholipid acyltransferase family protein [Candidatus Omnitrophota bacterium]
MKHWFRRYSIYAILRMSLFFLRLLPFKFACFLGRIFGKGLYFAIERDRRRIFENLDYAFRGKFDYSEKRRIARTLFGNLGQNLAELVFLPYIKKNIDKIVELEGKENIDAAFAKGKGVIALSAHFGNWELLAAYFAIKGYPISVVARQLRFWKFNNLLNDMRRSVGIDVLDRDQSLKKILSVLRKNQSVAILADQDVPSIEGVFVDFFGHPAYTPLGPAAIAQGTGAALLPIYIYRNGNRHRIVVEKEIELARTGKKEDDLAENTQRWMKITESYIRRYPEQWVWMHRRWKTQAVNSPECSKNSGYSSGSRSTT